MKSLFAAAALFGGLATAAQAADVAPMQAHVTRFGASTSVLVFFSAARDGFHVVATTQDGVGADARVARFVTVLASGQRGAISFPAGPSGKQATLVFSRNGSLLHIDEPERVASAQ